MIHLWAVAGTIVVLVVLWDTFETMVLPRAVARRRRVTRYFYLWTWLPYRRLARFLPGETRDRILAYYGPLAMLALLGLWAALLMLGFAMLFQAVPLKGDFGTQVYYSGTTFVTLGLGDIAPSGGWARAFTVLEAVTGFAFLALTIGYLPVVYQAFSRREVAISQMDARAGTPPTAGAFFARFPLAHQRNEIDALMRTWEEWAAQLLESHVSFPQLHWFRSQHDDQSWVAALTMVLDTSALLVALSGETSRTPAHLTFAMARHAAIDLAQRFEPLSSHPRRLTEQELSDLRALIGGPWPGGVAGESVERRLDAIREEYEPSLATLSSWLLMDVPPWVARQPLADDWQRGPRRA